MLPVTHGVKVTQKQILFYTFLMLFVVALPYLIGFSSIYYLAGSTILGLYFLKLAFTVFKNAEEKNCKKLFGYSILYLFLIFVLIVIDTLYA